MAVRLSILACLRKSRNVRAATLAPSAATFASPLRALTMMTSVSPAGDAAIAGTLPSSFSATCPRKTPLLNTRISVSIDRSPGFAVSSLESAWSSTWADVSYTGSCVYVYPTTAATTNTVVITIVSQRRARMLR